MSLLELFGRDREVNISSGTVKMGRRERYLHRNEKTICPYDSTGILLSKALVFLGLRLPRAMLLQGGRGGTFDPKILLLSSSVRRLLFHDHELVGFRDMSHVENISIITMITITIDGAPQFQNFSTRLKSSSGFAYSTLRDSLSRAEYTSTTVDPFPGEV